MSDELNRTCVGLERLLDEVETAGLPVAAAHLSAALELLRMEARRHAAPVRPALRIVDRHAS